MSHPLQSPSIGPPHLGPLRKLCRELVSCSAAAAVVVVAVVIVIVVVVVVVVVIVVVIVVVVVVVVGWTPHHTPHCRLSTASLFHLPPQVGVERPVGFVGSQPISLLRTHLNSVRVQRHFVSHKADGTRWGMAASHMHGMLCCGVFVLCCGVVWCGVVCLLWCALL